MKKLFQIVNHPELSKFFDGRDRVLCEKELLVPSGPTFRPDRINISSSGKISLMDYKTGRPKKGTESKFLLIQICSKRWDIKGLKTF